MDAFTQEFISDLQTKAVEYSPKVATAAAVLVAGLILAHGLKWLLSFIEYRFVKRTSTELDDIIFGKANKVAVYIFYSIVAVMAFGVMGVDVSPYIIAFLAILLAGPVAETINEVLNFVEKQYISRTDSQMDDVVFPLVRKAVVFTVYIFAGIIALDELGIEIVPFIAGLGIAGIAIGFAAKDTLANIIAGIFIIIDRPFVLGDRIEVWSAPKQSATWGDVIEIGLRTTKIRTTDNIILIIPNSEIYRRDIINYTTENPTIRVRIPVGVSYKSDAKKAEEIMLNIAGELDEIEQSPAPQVVFKMFGESSVDLELRVWIKDAKRRRSVSSYLGKRIKEEFDKQGIEIPYPKRDVYVHEAK